MATHPTNLLSIFAFFDCTSSARAPASCCHPSRRLVQCSVLSISMPALCQRTFCKHCPNRCLVQRPTPMSSAAHATTTHQAHSSPSILVSVSMRCAFTDYRSFSTFDAALRPTICRSLSPGYRAHFPANISRFFLLRQPVSLLIRHRRDWGTRTLTETNSVRSSSERGKGMRGPCIGRRGILVWPWPCLRASNPAKACAPRGVGGSLCSKSSLCLLRHVRLLCRGKEHSVRPRPCIRASNPAKARAPPGVGALDARSRVHSCKGRVLVHRAR